MNAIQRDKCIARRIARAGCVDALGIRRVRHDAEDTRVPTPRERVMAWRLRSGRVGIGNSFQFKRTREWRVTVPQPLCRPASQTPQSSPPVAAVQAGSRTPQPAVGNNTGTDRRQILPAANCEVAVSREGPAGNARAWQSAIASERPMRSARAGLRDDRRSDFNLPSVGGMSDPERADGRQSLCGETK